VFLVSELQRTRVVAVLRGCPVFIETLICCIGRETAFPSTMLRVDTCFSPRENVVEECTLLRVCNTHHATKLVEKGTSTAFTQRCSTCLAQVITTHPYISSRLRSRPSGTLDEIRHHTRR